jgi:hypothetical protein
MGARSVGSLRPPGAGTDDITADGEEGVIETVQGSRRNGRTRTRPVFDTRAVAGTAASVADAAEGRRATGVRLPRAGPNTLARSQVENGAVKGKTTRTTSQEAKSLGSIALSKDPPDF